MEKIKQDDYRIFDIYKLLEKELLLMIEWINEDNLLLYSIIKYENNL